MLETLRKFEGASLDDILAHVYRECGANATIVEANRIRRGGVGGFFAKEGFEVVVIPDPEHGAAEGTPGSAKTEAEAAGTSIDETNPAARVAPGRRLDLTEDEDELLADFLAGRVTAEPVPATPAPVRAAPAPAAPPAAAPPAAAAPAAAEEIETVPARRVLKASRMAAGEASARSLHPAGASSDGAGIEPVVALVAPAEFAFSNVFDRVLADEPMPADGRSAAAVVPMFDDLETVVDDDDDTFDQLPRFGEDDADETLTDDELRALLGVDDLADAVRAGGPSGSAGAAVLSSWQAGGFDDRATVADPAGRGEPDHRTDTVAGAMIDDAADESTLDALTRHFTTVDPTVADDGPFVIDEPAAEVPADITVEPDAAPTVEPDIAPEAPARRRTRTTASTSATRTAKPRARAEATPSGPAAEAATNPATTRRAIKATTKAAPKTAPKTAARTKPAPAKPAAAQPVPAQPAPAKATKAHTGPARRTSAKAAAPPARPAPVAALELMARYAAVPGAPEAPAEGTVVVVGAPVDALAVARGLFGDDTPIVLASPDATADGGPGTVTVLRDIEAAGGYRAGAATGRHRRPAATRQIVVVDAGTGMRGLAWARRVLDVLEPDHVRLAVRPTGPADDVRATADLLDGVVALDVVTGDGDTVPVEDLLGIGVPVGSIGGWPASPALWAALTLEGTNRG